LNTQYQGSYGSIGKYHFHEEWYAKWIAPASILHAAGSKQLVTQSI